MCHGRGSWHTRCECRRRARCALGGGHAHLERHGRPLLNCGEATVDNGKRILGKLLLSRAERLGDPGGSEMLRRPRLGEHRRRHSPHVVDTSWCSRSIRPGSDSSHHLFDKLSPVALPITAPDSITRRSDQASSREPRQQVPILALPVSFGGSSERYTSESRSPERNASAVTPGRERRGASPRPALVRAAR